MSLVGQSARSSLLAHKLMERGSSGLNINKNVTAGRCFSVPGLDHWSRQMLIIKVYLLGISKPQHCTALQFSLAH